jgi:hypothetical protein
MTRFRTSVLVCALFLLSTLGTGCLVLSGDAPRNGRCRRGKVLVKHHGKYKCKKRHHKPRKPKKPKKHKGHKKHKKHKKH